MIDQVRDMKKYIDYIYCLIDIVPDLQKGIEETYPDWKEDLIFVSVLGFIGIYIFDNYELISKDRLSKLFTLIEESVHHEDEYIGTAVATGLLEAMVNKGDKNSEKWRGVWQHFGKESKEYIKAWNKFCGVDMHLD